MPNYLLTRTKLPSTKIFASRQINTEIKLNKELSAKIAESKNMDQTF